MWRPRICSNQNKYFNFFTINIKHTDSQICKETNQMTLKSNAPAGNVGGGDGGISAAMPRSESLQRLRALEATGEEGGERGRVQPGEDF